MSDCALPEPLHFTLELRQWNNSEFYVTVNPELGLIINGTPHLVKLYFHRNKLSRLKAQVSGLLMHQALGDKHPNFRLSIFDVKAEEFHTFAGASERLGYLLLGEAAHMSAILAAARSTSQ